MIHNLFNPVLSHLKEGINFHSKMTLIDLARSVHMTEQETQEAVSHSKQLLPGDLILVKTPISFYEAMRRLYK